MKGLLGPLHTGRGGGGVEKGRRVCRPGLPQGAGDKIMQVKRWSSAKTDRGGSWGGGIVLVAVNFQGLFEWGCVSGPTTVLGSYEVCGVVAIFRLLCSVTPVEGGKKEGIPRRLPVHP